MVKMLGVVICIIAVAVTTAAQTVTGSQFTPQPADTFTDPPYTMSNYGLTWADYSNGVLGSSAMLAGYGGINLYTNRSRRMTIDWGGNVGIGTTSPGQLLQVGATYSQSPSIMIGGHDSNNSSVGNYSLLFGAWRDIVPTLTSGIVATPTWTCCGGYPASGYAGVRQNSLGFYTSYDPTSPAASSPNVLIAASGNVGIGITNPLFALDVAGQVHAAGGVVFPNGIQTQAYLGTTYGADYAEAVDVTGDRTKYEPGDVLVIDPNTPGKFLKSSDAYSALAAGIYSTKPGFVGRLKEPDPETSATEVPMAMVGRVPTKVTAENGPIKVGDLLVASSTPGRAMKGTDRSRMLGAVIGKALGSLDSGTGVIEVLVTLQ